MEQFKFIKLNINNARLIIPTLNEDFRGSVSKVYSREILRKEGIVFDCVEDLIIYSKKSVIRGLHFQKKEGQSKMVQVFEGKIFAVILDIDEKSETFGKWVSIEMINNGEVIYIPEKCAFGSLALENSIISCKCGNKFVAEYSDGILWNDKDIKIDWPLDELGVIPILSDKDKNLQLLKEYIDTKENIIKTHI